MKNGFCCDFTDQVLKAIVNNYNRSLNKFSCLSGINVAINNSEMDHLAIKASDSENYIKLVQFFIPKCSSLIGVKIDDRELATGELIEPLKLKNFGEFRFIELMEPKFGKVGNCQQLDHSEFFCRNLEMIEQTLSGLGVKYSVQSNNFHDSLVVIINQGTSQEIKFSDRRIEDVVMDEVASEKHEIIHYIEL